MKDIVIVISLIHFGTFASLVCLVSVKYDKRGDEFLIPNGTLKLHVGDKLLLISEKSKEEVNESE